jgi:hypothetical protein
MDIGFNWIIKGKPGARKPENYSYSTQNWEFLKQDSSERLPVFKRPSEPAISI